MRGAWQIALGALWLAGCGAWPLQARAGNAAPPRPLAHANPRQSDAAAVPVTVVLARDGDALVARFKVTAGALYAKRALARDEYPYDFDVVEVFVRNAKSARPGYFEFEVSPYNQPLQVNVIEPHQQYCFGVRDGYAHTATLTATGWEAELRIPLATLGWHAGESLELIGNAYAALGAGEQRVYWSLFELPAGKPDFHRPDAFRPLLDAR